jgi:hypothetical protein
MGTHAPGQPAKVTAVMNSAETAEFTRLDWLSLALAAIDQADINLATQERIAELLEPL